MRLSGLVVAAILLISVTLLAQHSSAGGGSSSGGSSHGGSSFSAGSSTSVSSHSSTASSGSSRVSHGTSSSAKAGSNARTHAPEHSASATPEKKNHILFWRHKEPTPKAPTEAAFITTGCKKGRICTCPGGGIPNAAGKCFVRTQVWCSGVGVGNGGTCGGQYWANDCRALAEQLAEEKRRIESQDDYGESLRYRTLENQYEQCLRRSRLPFGAYAFNSELLLDTP